MVDSDELLAIGSALAQTVRSQIKYSPNMDKKGQLFDGLKRSSLYKDLCDKYFIQRNNKSLINYIDKAQKAIELGAGVCSELVLVSLYLADLISIDCHNEQIYTSILAFTSDHCLLLLHQSKMLHDCNDYYLLTNNINGLQNISSLKNAVFVDPWIYCATNRLETLLERASSYGVKKNYVGKIFINGRNKSWISSLAHYESHKSKYYNILDNFYYLYEEQKLKLANNSDSFARGRRFSSVRNDLILDINKPYENIIVKIQSNYRGYLTRRNIQQLQRLTSLGEFFTRLNNQLSARYSGLGHSDRKATCIKNAINYLNKCVNNYDSPGEEKLVNLFQSIIRILPIVRSSNTVPRNLSIDTIDMTKSAEGLFNLAVTPLQKYEFEKIDGLSLDWIRKARNSHNATRGKYTALLNQITVFTTPNNLADILRNFYTNKAGYYQLVTDAIAQ